MALLPDAYKYRSQTFFKHRFLEEYIVRWALILGSLAKTRGTLRLWYCDVFSGPWESRDEDLSDTSVHRALTALAKARDRLQALGCAVELHAVFVEEDGAALQRLRSLCERFRDLGIHDHVLPGRFQEHATTIHRMLGEDPAVLLVDPTGWKHIAMDHLITVADGRFRDLLIRVPFEVHRFKSREEEKIREQMAALFGVAADRLPLFETEDGTIGFYCEQLRHRDLRAGWMALPDAKSERTAAWMVAAGHHEAVLEVFREVEQAVAGGEASSIRHAIREERDHPGQLGLFAEGGAPTFDTKYASKRPWNPNALWQDIVSALDPGPSTFRAICGRVLQHHHITARELSDLLMSRRGELINVRGISDRASVLRKDHIVILRPRTRRVSPSPPATGSTEPRA